MRILLRCEALEGAHADPTARSSSRASEGSRRHWLMRTAPLGDGATLIRFVDRSEARAAEQMRVDFVANASHELRTPLATLIGYTETLREQIGRDRSRHARALPCGRPRRGAAHAARGRGPDFAVADRGREIQRSDRCCRARAADRPGRSRARGGWPTSADRSSCGTSAANLPPIAADRGQILQLLDNLLTNALRYGEPGTPVTVAARAEGPMVHLSVADQGEGHRARTCRARDRALLPRRYQPQPLARRDRAWPVDRQAYRRAPPRTAEHRQQARARDECARPLAGRAVPVS